MQSKNVIMKNLIGIDFRHIKEDNLVINNWRKFSSALVLLYFKLMSITKLWLVLNYIIFC